LVPARFVKRESRFSATVLLDGQKKYIHIPNSGRLQELLTPQREVFLLHKGEGKIERKTNYTLVLTRYGSGYVSVESAKANDLFEEGLKTGVIMEFSSHNLVKREKRVGMSRIDFYMEDSRSIPTYIEVKSVTLVVDDTALFPDAPTSRGRKHLRELIDVKKKGNNAAIAFIIQRPDALNFSPNDAEDPGFGKLLREAFEKGVRIIAYRCSTNINEIYVTDPVPVLL